MVNFNSIDDLEASSICFADVGLHCYIPKCLGEKKEKNKVLTSAIPNFAYA